MHKIPYTIRVETHVTVTLPVSNTEHWTYLLSHSDVTYIHNFGVALEQNYNDKFIVTVYNDSISEELQFLWWLSVGY